MYRIYSKQEIRVHSWLVFIGILIGLFTLLCFYKLYVEQIPLSTFLEKLVQIDTLIPLLVFGLSIAAIFDGFLSLQEEKIPKNHKHKEKIDQ
jgi:hypothetical protein